MRARLVGPAACSLALVLGLSLPNAIAAQQSSSPVSDALRASLKRAETNLVAAARAMPADKYSFAPTPARMSFGKLVLHVAGSNDFMCSTIAGTKAPERSKIEPGESKDKLVAALEQSFQYCTTSLANVTDSSLGEEVPFFGGRTISRASAMLGLSEDWGDHYSLAATELRLNGVLPPTAKRGEK